MPLTDAKIRNTKPGEKPIKAPPPPPPRDPVLSWGSLGPDALAAGASCAGGNPPES